MRFTIRPARPDDAAAAAEVTNALDAKYAAEPDRESAQDVLEDWLYTNAARLLAGDEPRPTEVSG